MYIQFGNLSTVKTYFAARYTWDLGGVKLDKWILSPRCYGAQQSWIAGAAIAGNYLAVSCQLDSDALVFRADRFGWRKPVETIGQGDAISGLVAVGP